MSTLYPYDEARIRATLRRIAQTYAEAGRPFPDPADPDALVWLARIQSDVANLGLLWEVATRKHLVELRIALGLGFLPFGRLDGDAQPVHVDGYNLVVDGGGPTLILAAFTQVLYKRFLELPAAAVDALLDPYISRGFTGVQFFTCFGGPGWQEELHVDHPGYYPRLPEFASALHARGLYALPFVFAGPYLPPDLDAHYQRVQDAFRPYAATTILCLDNEDHVGWERFAAPAGFPLCSVGTFGGERRPRIPNWGTIDAFEPTRVWPTTFYDAGSGLWQLIWGWSAAPPWPGTQKLTAELEGPKWGDPDPWGRGDPDPTHAFLWAQVNATVSPILVYLSWDTQYCAALRPATAVTCDAFARGARLGFSR